MRRDGHSDPESVVWIRPTETHAATIKLVLRFNVLQHIKPALINNLRLRGCVLGSPVGVRFRRDKGGEDEE